VLLMAAVAYYWLEQTIIASQGRDSVLRQSKAIYVLVALMWLVPDQRIEKALARRES
jgi:hypothetical protein